MYTQNKYLFIKWTQVSRKLYKKFVLYKNQVWVEGNNKKKLIYLSCYKSKDCFVTKQVI